MVGTVTNLIKTFLIISCFSAACSNPGQKQSPFFGIVSSATPEATLAGEEILKKGGNAIDAAVAVSFALAVTEPAMSGLGGGTQILVGLPDRKPFMINGTTRSPKNTPTDMDENRMSYHQRTTIPSTVKTLYYAWKKYGSGNLEWEELVKPAIRFAENGFVVGSFRHKIYKRYEEQLKASPHHTDFVLGESASIPEIGDTVKQPVLAGTLSAIASGGADVFYKGFIAEAISEDMKLNGGWITAEDLSGFPDPEELPALNTTYHGYQVYTSTPPCGGWVMLLALNAIEQLPPFPYPDSIQTPMQIIRALEIAHNDRLANPVLDLENYKADISKKISKEYPVSLKTKRWNMNSDPDEGGETTHFSIVDKDGLVVAVTASINAYFGALAASPNLGFLYNTYMDDFEFGNSDHPWAIGPGKMAYSSMTPTIVKRDDKNVMVLGSPGSARIISAIAQVIRYWIDEKQDIVQAVANPRYHVNRNRVYVERLPDTVIIEQPVKKAGLIFRTFRTDIEQNGLNAYFGGVHAIAFENGKWVGAADPRRDGTTEIQE